MNETTKRRVVGAAVLVATGILIPVLLVWWAQPGDRMDDSVRVYDIDEPDESRSSDSGEAGAAGSDTESTASEPTSPESVEVPELQPAETDDGSKTGAEPNSPIASSEDGPASSDAGNNSDGGDGGGPDGGNDSGQAIDEDEQREESGEAAGKSAAAGEDETPPASETDEDADESTPDSAAPAPNGDWIVQIGSFNENENATRMKDEAPDAFPAFIAESELDGQRYYRVRVGPYASEADAEAAAERLRGAGHATQVQQVDDAD